MWVNNLLNCVVDTLKETGLLSSHVIETLSFQTIIQTSIRFVLPVIISIVSSNVRVDMWCTDITEVPFPKYQLGEINEPPLSQQKV
jgi:hypothetical protein